MRLQAHLPITALAAVLALGLAACGGSDGSDGSSAPSATTSESSTASPSDLTSTEATSTPSSDATAAAQTIKVGKSVTDDVMGDTFTVIDYIRGYQPSAAARAKFSALDDEQVVLVHVKVKASTKYYDSFGADSFYLTNTGNDFDQASTTILDDEIKAAGYPPLEDAKTGKSSEGWVVFTPDKKLSTYVLRYKRLAAGTSTGKTITAKNFDVPLG